MSADAPVRGPAAGSTPLRPDEVAPLMRKNVGTVRRWLNSGALHGHRPYDVRGAHWLVAQVCVEVFLAGHDEHEQRRRCPMCTPVAPVRRLRPSTR